VNEKLQLPSIVHQYPGFKQLYACINTKLVCVSLKKQRQSEIKTFPELV